MGRTIALGLSLLWVGCTDKGGEIEDPPVGDEGGSGEEGGEEGGTEEGGEEGAEDSGCVPQEEVCNGEDDDCDGVIDNGLATESWYADADGDGYGDPDSATEACEQPEDTVADGTDCDDTSAAASPAFDEDRCDGLDNDCDGSLDEDHKSGWRLVTLHIDGAVYEIDPTTAALTALPGLDLSPVGASFNPPSADVREDGLAILSSNKPEPLVVEFDPCEGTTRVVGTTGAGDSGAIAFGSTGTLFMIDNDTDTLNTVDVTTGSATQVGSLVFDSGYSGLSYDCREQRLLGIDANGPALFEVDTSTGATSLITFLSDGDWRAVGVEFDARSGKLWASDGPSLWEIDPRTGAMTKVGDFGELTYVNDLTLIPPCD